MNQTIAKYAGAAILLAAGLVLVIIGKGGSLGEVLVSGAAGIIGGVAGTSPAAPRRDP